jgi:transposase
MSTAEQIATLENRITELELENKRLHETVAYLTRKLYGRSSEKTSALSMGQVSLFDEAEVYADPHAPEPDLKEVQGYIRRKYKGQRAALLKDIPHDKRLCTLAKEDRYCEACGTDLVSVGEEFIRTEIEFIPAKVRVIDYYRETFECRTCRKNGEPYMEKSPMPYPVIQHSMASPSTVAWIMHQKFVNHLPLYRQENE